MTPNLSDAAYLEQAARAHLDGDLPTFLGALASVSEETLTRMSSLLAAMFSRDCPNCSGSADAWTRHGPMHAPTLGSQGC
jgi:hypothetical protein